VQYTCTIRVYNTLVHCTLVKYVFTHCTVCTHTLLQYTSTIHSNQSHTLHPANRQTEDAGGKQEESRGLIEH